MQAGEIKAVEPVKSNVAESGNLKQVQLNKEGNYKKLAFFISENNYRQV